MKGKINVALLGPYQTDYQKIMGGAHSHMFHLVDALNKYDDVELHVVSVSESIRDDKIVSNGNVVIHYLSSPGFMYRFLAGVSVDFFKVLREVLHINPDIIHAQMTVPLYGFPASFLSGKYPILLRVHGIASEEAKNWGGDTILRLKARAYKLMEDFVFRRVKYIIVDTAYVKEKIAGRCRSDADISVIPIGVDPIFFSVENKECYGRLLFVGGIEPRKNLKVLLEGVKLVRESIPEVSLHIAGRVRREDYYRELLDYVEKNNLSGNVSFTGALSQSELLREYGECSVFVLTSSEESQGVVLVEAMAAGKPTVASNSGGIRDVVDDGITGFLVDCSKPESFAEKVISLLRDGSRRRMMGVAGREKARSYSYRRIAEETHELYVRIMNEKVK